MLPNKLETNHVKFNLERNLLNTGDLLINTNKWIIIFICMWVIWPYINYRLGFLPFLVLLLLWVFTTDFRWLWKGLSLDLFMFVVWVLTLIPYILTGSFRYGETDQINVLIAFMLFFSGVFINHYYMYYIKNIEVLGKISFFSILFYFIASVQTYLGLKEFPLAARLLATGSSRLQETYYSLGIGDFGFVYSAVFLNILLLFFVIKKLDGVRKVYKYLCLVVFFMITIMLISASYLTSLLLMVTGLLMVTMVKGKKSIIFVSFLVLLFVLSVPKDAIGNTLIYLANLFQSNVVIKTKFLDLAQGFLGDSFGAQTSGRGRLYLDSLQTFLKNPFFGIYGPFGNELNAKVGGHSGWFDLMAYYGLFGSMPLFVVIFLNFKKQLKFYSNHPYFYFLLTSQILFIGFGFINPITYIYQIGFVLFAIAPAIPFLPYSFSRRGRNLNTLKRKE